MIKLVFVLRWSNCWSFLIWLDQNYWLGGRDDIIEGTWIWASTDQIFKYTDWYPGQPNNYENNEDCLHMYASFNMKWNDFSCTRLSGFICERKWVWKDLSNLFVLENFKLKQLFISILRSEDRCSSTMIIHIWQQIVLFTFKCLSNSSYSSIFINSFIYYQRNTNICYKLFACYLNLRYTISVMHN